MKTLDKLPAEVLAMRAAVVVAKLEHASWRVREVAMPMMGKLPAAGLFMNRVM